MAQVRPNTGKEVGPVSEALRQLARLLARQAACECDEQRVEHASTLTRSPLGEAEMSGGDEYLRANDIARLTGVTTRTARRWIAGGARLVAKSELERLLSPAPNLI